MQESIDKAKKVMVDLGFSEEEAEKQLADLGEIISVAMLKAIVDENPNDKDQILNDTENYLKDHYPAEKLQEINTNTVAPLVKEYFSKISVNLSEEQKERLINYLI